MDGDNILTVLVLISLVVYGWVLLYIAFQEYKDYQGKK